MLKALELFGFKSFADRTRFEFPSGISVVVGPNGSGKSNIVDAIKWVLGEQSAKSLRGKDMADVIFKGSGGTSGRKALNTAEATLIIDNSDGRLKVDAPEVHVTRRVYRSGEGEYLVNRQPCRLKDIRDMFRGTGVGTDAYSLIEQGKVDQLLQATPRDRRAIFEEAAGISRFKAKKIEAQRRLERVDQNLLRLSDIVDEVGSRLRSIRAQASKAQRYKEYSDRLQQLRTFVGLTDWRKLTDRLTAAESRLTELKEQAAGISAHAEAIEARALELEVEASSVDETIRTLQAAAVQSRERLVHRETTLQHERARLHDLDEEEARHRQNLAAMSVRVGQIQQRRQKIEQDLQVARTAHDRLANELARHERDTLQAASKLETLRAQNEARRSRYLEQMRNSATLGNRVSSLESQLATARAAHQQLAQRLSKLEQQCGQLASDLAHLLDQHARMAARTDEKATALDAVQRRLEHGQAELMRRKDELTQLRLRHNAVSERRDVLLELERRWEGISAGVQQVLQDSTGNSIRYGRVHGLVAHLLRADVDVAPLVDAALGGRAQHVVVSGPELRDFLSTRSAEISGTVGFIQLDGPLLTQTRPGINLSGQPGVFGRADQRIEVAPQYRPLMLHLLGTTWMVDRLDTALQLHQQTLGACRFVTQHGDLLEPDGTVIVGASAQHVGLVSRKSQLSALELEIGNLSQQIETVEGQIDRQQAEVYGQQQLLQRLTQEHKEAFAQQNQCEVQTQAVQERLDDMTAQRESVQGELHAGQAQVAELRQQLEQSQSTLAEIQAELETLDAAVQRADHEIELQLSNQSDLERVVTKMKVELATHQQRLEGLVLQRRRIEEDHGERERASAELGSQLEHCLQRRTQTQRVVLDATSEIALLYLQKEATAQQAAEHAEVKRALSRERQQLASQVQQQRQQQRRVENKQHRDELALNEARLERHALEQRLRDDYGIEIADLDEPLDEEQMRERAEIEEEISTLRHRINNLGAVNLEALDELEDLESRFQSLDAQYQDLAQAKQSLERIIVKINADSRRLFAETLEAIRGNFQTLYRQAFGGGRADLVLEDAEDILEAGIDIIATPPGKPEFNNSLLSGGEKALTAVSLLMAIFQYRPSPFCVLDEVDAPFDEANISRFIGVLNGFLGWTRFVIVTHSKKTMTAATTLYGITMQESGVSKRVSVKFDDVSEDGHISQEALRRQEADDAA